jgi:hypothetical protein
MKAILLGLAALALTACAEPTRDRAMEVDAARSFAEATGRFRLCLVAPDLALECWLPLDAVRFEETEDGPVPIDVTLAPERAVLHRHPDALAALRPSAGPLPPPSATPPPSPEPAEVKTVTVRCTERLSIPGTVVTVRVDGLVVGGDRYGTIGPLDVEIRGPLP